MNNYPDFIIIGAMKCATSTLHEQLAVQPGIFMSELKEPNFFSDDDQYAKGMEWYLSHFKSAEAKDLCGESSTHYSKLPTYPKTIERIAKYLPDVKLIYVMRHPIDRLKSQYIHEWSQKVISVEINQAIHQYPELIDSLVRWGISSISVDVNHVENTYIAIARAEKRLLLEAARERIGN